MRKACHMQSGAEGLLAEVYEGSVALECWNAMEGPGNQVSCMGRLA